MREDEVREAERVTIEEARRRGAAGGVETDAPSYSDETGTADLGVEEPVVRQGDRGATTPTGEPSAG